MKTKLWAICLMVLTTLLTSAAQLFYKAGAEKLRLDIISAITNYHLLAGLFLYMVGAVLMIAAFKGGELSVLYPIIATSYIWVGLFSYILFHESLNPLRWLGIVAISFGVIFVSLGTEEELIEEAGAVL